MNKNMNKLIILVTLLFFADTTYSAEVFEKRDISMIQSHINGAITKIQNNRLIKYIFELRSEKEVNCTYFFPSNRSSGCYELTISGNTQESFCGFSVEKVYQIVEKLYNTQT